MADKDYFQDVKPDESFYCHDGTYIRNVNELLQKIKMMDDSTFSSHVDSSHDDFADWIEKSLLFLSLAGELRGVTEKERYYSIIQRKIKLLETKENLLLMPAHIERQIEKKIIKLIPLLILLLAVFFVIFFYSYRNNEQKSIMKLTEIDQKVDNFMSKQMMADNVIFKHLYGLETILNASINKSVFTMDRQLISDSFSVSSPLPPKPRLDERNIRVNNNSAAIFLKNPSWAKIDNTKSMEPTLVGNSFALQMKPEKPEDLIVGDIISFSNKFDEAIIHRIVELGNDSNGWFAVTKGDANYYKDMEKVRFNQLRGVVIGIIY